MHRLSFSTKGTGVFFSLIITFIFAWLAIAPPYFFQTILSRFEDVAYDLRLSMLLVKNPAPKTPIVIVDIDEKSLREQGRFPWPREKLAKLVENLYAQGATVIAFDMLFSEPERPYTCTGIDEDAVFAKAISAGNGKVILGSFLSNEHEISIGKLPPPAVELTPLHLADLALPSRQSYISNIPSLEDAANIGGVLSITPDSDGILRRYSLLQRYGNNLYPALALQAVKLYFLEKNISINVEHIGKDKVISGVKLGNALVPTDEEGRVYIPYIGPARTFPYYSATDILNNRLPPNQLQNAIVFVGTSAVGLGDVRATPVGSVYPGVEIHATVANGLFTNHFPYVPSWSPGAELCLILALGILLTLLFSYTGPFWIGLITIGTLMILFSGSTWLWQNNDIILPIMLPTILTLVLAVFHIAYGFFLESRRRNDLKHVFEQYVPSGRVDEIIKDPEAANAFEGERKVMSVLFMDIRNFTSISEKLNIVELKKLLNFFLTEMTTIIFKHGGTIDKYVGDMVMAFWGAPLSDAEHARHAISAGLEMLATIDTMQKKLSDMGLPFVRVGIGVNTGMMDVGDMGSNYRRAYTVLGDAVNLASRLESLTKYYGVSMLAGQEAAKNQSGFVFKLIDKVRVKGKHVEIAIYEPVGLRENVSKETLAMIEKHEKALEFYFNQQWADAKLLFTELNETLYLERIKQFEKTPPPADWDGVWEHSEK